ncbi:MAG: hypothetical protein CL677_01170 [Bdellovibrionaceae bacterium]|nr:hypothetical protein [Pseudobdellovibrionaceae bacterium]|tara:strand:- start:152049 stop:154166 length:2118 start_codon:yes stop_codon:yes gene_type:complete
MIYKLIVTLHGNQIHELELDTSKEYVAGRGKTCDIVLDGEKGISRQHIKFSFDNTWKVQLIAKYGALIYSGETCEEIELDGDAVFAAPPFEFKLFIEDPMQDPVVEDESDPLHAENADSSPLDPLQANDNINDDANALVVQSPPPSDQDGAYDIKLGDEDAKDSPSNLPANPDETFQGNMESTDPGISKLQLFLEAKYSNGKKEVFKLEGNLWVAGRDPGCEIFLKDDHISRQHFELTQTNEGYYITDLGSSNGTYINKKKLKPHVPTPLESGDRVKIKRVRIKFNVVDEKFEQAANDIDEKQFMAPVPISGSGGTLHPMDGPGSHPFNNNVPMMYEGPAVERIENDSFNLLQINTWSKAHKIRATIILVGAIFAFMMMGETPQQKEGTQESTSVEPGIANLTQAQKESLAINYNLANQLKRQGRFDLCIAKVEEIHGLIEPYKDSKKILSQCEIAKQIKLEREAKERLEAQREKNQKRVSQVVDHCRKYIQSFQTVEQVDECLLPAIELDPGNPEYFPLRDQIQQRQVAAENAAQEAARRQQQIAEGNAMFRKAKAVYDRKDLKRSITQLQKYLNSGYPDPNGNKRKARGMIASARAEFDKILSVELNQCKQLAEKNEWKPADEACNKVLKQDSSNQQAKEVKSKLRIRLSKKMKEIYENASIEENFGNIEAANELWEKILDEDFQGGTEFYDRAKRKKRKYGL